MKMFIGAIALIVAAPVAAQTAPPADTHATHDQHQQGKHEHSDKGCCCKEMAKSEKMECCAEHGESHGGEHGAHSAS